MNTNPFTPTQADRLQARYVFAGSFEKNLITTWMMADSQNKRILEDAFINTQFDLT